MRAEELLERNSLFSLSEKEKKAFFDKELSLLTDFHRTHCPEYANILDALGYEGDNDNVPYLPVSLFRKIRLESAPGGMTLTSSGTTGSEKTRVSIDAETSMLQQQVLARSGMDFLGRERRNMLILDSSEVFYKRGEMSARTAAIRGFSLFSRKRTFALNEDMSPDIEKINDFFRENEGRDIFLFGLTYLVWDSFYMALKKAGIRPDLSKATIIHGGGWKKLSGLNIRTDRFERELKEYFKSPEIVEYYGMAEQTGSIFFRCSEGYFHASDFSDITARDEKTLEKLEPGKEGLLHVSSLVPRSYPGHVILTEDRGRIIGRDGCRCGRCGAYFTVTGRVENSELRGCSNVL